MKRKHRKGTALATVNPPGILTNEKTGETKPQGANRFGYRDWPGLIEYQALDFGGPQVTEEQAMGLPGVGRGVRLMCGVIAGLTPYRVRNAASVSQPTEVMDPTSLLDNPDPSWHGRTAWTSAVVRDLMFNGNAFADKRSMYASWNSLPTVLPLVPASAVTWERSRDPEQPNLDVYVIHTSGSVRDELDPWEMWHAVINPRAGKRMGQGILDLYQMELRIMLAVENAQWVVMRKGRPVGVLSVDADMTDDELKAAKQAFLTGVGEDGIAALIKARFDQVGWSATDLALIPAREYNLRLASDITGVPPYLLGVPAESRVYCADTETEILTTDGWKRHDEVAVGDLALTLDMDSMTSQWQPVSAVNVFPGPHRVVRLESKTHSSVTTGEHRWPVLPYGRPSMEWTTTDQMQARQRILAAAPLGEFPTEAKWSDAYVELAAWTFTEGHLEPYGRFQISQSETVNPQNVARIRSALTELFGPGDRGAQIRREPHWIERPGPNALSFRLNKLAAAPLLANLPDNVPSYRFLLELTRAQLHLFIDTAIAADGTTVRSGARVFCQKRRAHAEALQFACLLAGISGQLRQNKAGMWQLILSASPIRKPKAHRRFTSVETIDGPVWCPTTPNGTWLARRGHAVYFTGNSNMETEWSNFLRTSVDPYLTAIQDPWSMCFPRGTVVRFNVDELRRAETKVRWETYKIAVELGAMSVEEVRQAERMGPPIGAPQPQPALEGAPA